MSKIKEREIVIKLIECKTINTNRLARFFAEKYNEKHRQKP